MTREQLDELLELREEYATRKEANRIMIAILDLQMSSELLLKIKDIVYIK